MIFLFEQIAYSTDFLEKVLPKKEKGFNWDLPKGFVRRKDSENSCKLDGVGYLYNANSIYALERKDPSAKIVFVLPKVFWLETEEKDEDGYKKGIAFGKEISRTDNFNYKDIPSKFLSELSLWVCSSIAQYRKLDPDDNAVDTPDVRHFSSSKSAPVLVDIMDAMRLFYAENQNLFVFTAKNKHSGNNRIDWRRTVSRTQPFLQEGTPIYMNLENKKKMIDVDDRLLVLYFSAMHYIEETFNFKMPRSEFYVPIRVNEFRRLLGHRGLVELRRIKHKYFADKLLKLYNIMKAFFEWGGIFSANDYSSEYLLTSKYNNVFESMIDRLVSDDLPKQMEYLKSQKDKKEVDHLYKDRQLIFANKEQQIWFIGDSKYYSNGKKIDGSSIYKQFTYAKNIVQYNIDDLLKNGVNKKYKGLRYRDELTEGYSVTPNFFIRGYLPKSESNIVKDSPQFREPYFRKDSTEDLIKDEKDSGNYQLVDDDGNLIGSKRGQSLWSMRNRHFENRLFDRDTLLLQVYNVNFLYVLKAYTSKRSSLREEFKHDAREKFRKNFLDLLDKRYMFWLVWPKTKPIHKESREEAFINKFFKALNGKIFKQKNSSHLILALERVSNKSDGFYKCRDACVLEKIKNDCDYFHTIAKELLSLDQSTLREAHFKKADVKFDEIKNGFFVKRKAFEKNKIGKEHKLPASIMDENGTEHKLTGAFFGDIDLERLKIQKSPLDKYYFLPCKED